MKQFLISTIFLSVHFSGVAQFFSGEQEYRVQIIPKKEGLDVDSVLALQPGTSSRYLITDGYYKSVYYRDGAPTYSYTYHGDTKRMFDEYVDKDIISFRDSRKANNVKIRTIIYKDSIKTIAGHRCFMVERVYETYINKSYYTLDLKINTESFKDHAAGDWYNQIKEVDGALSMGSVTEYPTHYEVHEVEKVTFRKLMPADFDLPKDKLVVASAYALEKQVALEKPSTQTIQCYQQQMQAAVGDRESVNSTVYVAFIVTHDGKLTHIEPDEEDENGFHTVAVNIMKTCGLKFTPGEIDNKPVDSLMYFPIEFSK